MNSNTREFVIERIARDVWQGVLSLLRIDSRLIQLARPLERTWETYSYIYATDPRYYDFRRKRKFDIARNPRVSQNEGNLILRE